MYVHIKKYSCTAYQIAILVLVLESDVIGGAQLVPEHALHHQYQLVVGDVLKERIGAVERPADENSILMLATVFILSYDIKFVLSTGL
jgi:hypothetical protein